MRRWWIYFILTLVIGYGSDWAPFYASLFYGEDLQVLGSVAKFRHPCSAKNTEKSFCSNEYIIPAPLIRKDREAFGAGTILSASRYYCDSNAHTVVYDDPTNPGRVFDLMNLYQTVDLKQLACAGKDLHIEAWSRYGARKTGHVGGFAVLGSYNSVERVQRLVQFFTTDIVLFCALFFIGLYALSQMLHTFIGAAVRVNPFERALGAWLLYLLSSSGLLQIFVPITQVPQVFNHLTSFLALISHFTPLTYRLLGHENETSLIYKTSKIVARPIIGNLPVSIATITAAALMFSPYYIFIFAPLFLILATMTLLESIRAKDSLLAAYSLICFIAGMKALNVPYLPNPQITVFFVGMIVFYDLVKRFRQGARLTQVLFLLKNIGPKKKQRHDLQGLLNDTYKYVPAGRITLLTLQPEGSCKITILKAANGDSKFEIIDRDNLPPVFAHCISTRQPIWHLHQDSSLLRNVRKESRPPVTYQGSHMTIIPLLGEALPVGALAITDYPEDWVNDVDKNLELATLFRLLGPVFIEQIQNNELLQQSEWSTINQEVHKIFSKLKSQINASTTQLNQSALFQQVIEGVSFQLKSYGFIAKLDSQTHEFEILGIHGYPKEVSDRLLNGRIFALPENEQGPVPLAINRKQTVIVSDVRLLRGVLHENTNFFFDRAGTRSCAAVPIFESKTDALGSLQEKTIWGILFLERNITEPFTLKSTTGLEQVSDEIDNLLSDVNQKLIFEKTQKALSSLLPERVLQKVIDQKLEREEDYGTLLMIDLKESTKIALEVGSDVWLKNAQSLLPTIDEIARRHNLTLQTFIWDAFYLTYSSETPSEQVVVRMLDFINEISQEIEKWYQQHYGSLFLNSGIRKQKARFCLTFGDTSRGFVEGKTRSWSIVGGEMSCISKFEDVCKKLDGVVFADESIRAGLDPLVWNSTNQQVPSTRRNIYVASVSWQDLMQRGFPNTKAA